MFKRFQIFSSHHPILRFNHNDGRCLEAAVNASNSKLTTFSFFFWIPSCKYDNLLFFFLRGNLHIELVARNCSTPQFWLRTSRREWYSSHFAIYFTPVSCYVTSGAIAPCALFTYCVHQTRGARIRAQNNHLGKKIPAHRWRFPWEQIWRYCVCPQRIHYKEWSHGPERYALTL